MRNKADDERLMIDYLLGELSEEDQAQIEERFLRDYEYLERLQAIEEDLNDSYIRGELSGREREQFEKRVSASPEWRQRIEFARALSEVRAAPSERAVAPAQAQPETVSWWKSLPAFLRGQRLAFSFALAAAAVAILIAGSWLVLETRRLRAEIEQLQAERQQSDSREQQLQQQEADERARADRLAQELERERDQRGQLERELEKPPPERSIISLVLMPGVRGEEEATTLRVPRDAELLRLNLYIQGPTPYESYRAELRTVGGNLIWSRDRLTARNTPSGKAVAVTLPASALSAGKYEMALKGVISKEQIEDVGYYYFSVVKK